MDIIRTHKITDSDFGNTISLLIENDVLDYLDRNIELNTVYLSPKLSNYLMEYVSKITNSDVTELYSLKVNDIKLTVIIDTTLDELEYKIARHVVN